MFGGSCEPVHIDISNQIAQTLLTLQLYDDVQYQTFFQKC